MQDSEFDECLSSENRKAWLSVKNVISWPECKHVIENTFPTFTLRFLSWKVGISQSRERRKIPPRYSNY